MAFIDRVQEVFLDYQVEQTRTLNTVRVKREFVEDEPAGTIREFAVDVLEKLKMAHVQAIVISWTESERSVWLVESLLDRQTERVFEYALLLREKQ